MRNIPEFQAVGVSNVHGGNLPYRIWEAFIAKASEAKAYPEEDWPAPPKQVRAARSGSTCPGNECLYTVSAAPAPPPGPTTVAAGRSHGHHRGAGARLLEGDQRHDHRRLTNSIRPRPLAAYAPAGAIVGSCAGPPAPPTPPPRRPRRPRPRRRPPAPHRQAERTMTDLHDLLTLQHHDTTIDQLRHRRATLPERTLVTGIEGQLARLRHRAGGGRQGARPPRRPAVAARRPTWPSARTSAASSSAGCRPPACPARRRR